MQTKHLGPGLLKCWYQTGKAAKICPSVSTLLIVSSTFSKVVRCGTLLAVLKDPCKRTHISQGRWDFWWRQNFNFSGPRESVLIVAAAFIAFPPPSGSISPVCAARPAAVSHHCSSQKEEVGRTSHWPVSTFGIPCPMSDHLYHRHWKHFKNLSLRLQPYKSFFTRLGFFFLFHLTICFAPAPHSALQSLSLRVLQVGVRVCGSFSN